MKKFILIFISIIFIGCSENQNPEYTEYQKHGFVCEPTGDYGYTFFAIYDGQKVYSYHDKIHLRDQGWSVSELRGKPFEYHFDSSEHPITEWYIPKGEYDTWKSKRILHEVGANYLSPTEYLTRLAIDQESDYGDSKALHSCSVGDIEKMNKFVADRKNNMFDESDKEILLNITKEMGWFGKEFKNDTESEKTANKNLKQDNPFPIPIVRVAPIYPDRALSRGLEGYCDMRFDVNTKGEVINPTSNYCSNSIFERPSKRAVKKFKYSPAIIDGQPANSVDVSTRITFKIDNES